MYNKAGLVLLLTLLRCDTPSVRNQSWFWHKCWVMVFSVLSKALKTSSSQVYFKQLCRKCQKGFNPYRVEAIQCQVSYRFRFFGKTV